MAGEHNQNRNQFRIMSIAGTFGFQREIELFREFLEEAV
jgi:hypothetical protein